MADWANLADDLLFQIINKINCLKAVVRFSVVCTHWRQAASKSKVTASFNIPWIILPRERDSPSLDLFILSKSITYRRHIPDLIGKRVLSSQGWLMTISKDHNIQLLHPFTLHKINLPQLKTSYHLHWPPAMPDYFTIYKFLLSANPSSTSDYTVVILRMNKILV